MNHVLSTGSFRMSTGVAMLDLLGSFGFSQAVRPDLDEALAATTCPEQIGHWPFGPSHAVAIDGDTAFFGVGSVLRAADVSDPGNPAVLSEIPLGNLIVDMEITTTSLTFNTTEEGTYGQFISGTTSDAAITQARPSAMIQLSQSDSGNNGFRTNLGLLNITGNQVEVLIELFDRHGSSLGTTTAVLLPFEHRQVNRVFREVTESAGANGFARVSTQSPRGAFFAYSSVIDNRSGDPVFMPAWRIQE